MDDHVKVTAEAPQPTAVDDTKTRTESPYTRLRDLFFYSFARADYDDPHLPDTPEELKEFGSNTVFVMGAGLLFGGIRQWLRERSMPDPLIPEAFSKAERAKLMGEIKTRQLIRVLDGSLRGGLWCGWLAALYFGVQGLAAYARQMRDPWNTVMGAWTCGAVAGYALGPKGILAKMQSTAGAVFLAGLIGYPTGQLQLYLEDKIRSEQPNTSEAASEKPKRMPYPVRNYDVVAAVIGKLDQSLNDSEKYK